MFRFGSITLGVLLVGLGVYLRWFEAPMSSSPEATSLEAIARLSGPDQHFVDFPGTVDMRAKLYRTGIEAPAYAPCDPRPSHPLEGEWTKLVGCTVVLPSAPLTDVVTVTESRDDVELPSGQALRKRVVLAPFPSQPELWVLSRAFDHSPKVADPSNAHYHVDLGRGPLMMMRHVTDGEMTWIRTQNLSGPLARMTDLPRLRTDFDGGAFAEGIQLAMGKSVDMASAYVVLADGRRPIERPSQPSLPRVIAPVVGTTGLFLALDWDGEPSSSGQITGILEPLLSGREASIIRSRTPDDVNRERESTANFSIGLGAALIFFGVVLIGIVKLLTHRRHPMRQAHR